MFQPNQNSYGSMLTGPQATNQQVSYGDQLMGMRQPYRQPMPAGMVGRHQFDPNNMGIQMIRGNPQMMQWRMQRQQQQMPPTGGQMRPPQG